MITVWIENRLQLKFSYLFFWLQQTSPTIHTTILYMKFEKNVRALENLLIYTHVLAYSKLKMDENYF